VLIWSLTAAGVIPNGFSLAGGQVRILYGGAALTAGLGMLATGLWMLWSSKVGKVRHREKLLEHYAWRGNERVLDVGCGRGLMLVGSAKRLTTGMATGIDIWQAEDLSGNEPGAALENARREGVEDRVAVQTADMRAMPFQDGAFDLVVSRVAIHNIYDPAERVKAIHEIARVLKPGGEAIIEDIRHERQYVDAFRERGCGEISRLDSRLVSVLWGVVTMGSFRPMTLRVRKGAQRGAVV
jgi:arsenite methyltransferase